MNWGKSIVAAFILFASFIATLVTVCVKQDINLVTKEYYKEELAYQEQIHRLSNTQDLHEPPAIAMEGNSLLSVTFTQFSEVDKGALKLFRPSDPALDKQFEITSSEKQTQYFSTQGLKKGMYRARMLWTMHGKEFYIEQVIHI